MRIEFDEAAHVYTVTVEGRQPEIWPSVSEVMRPLQDFSGVPADVLERAQKFGTAVHKMVELYNLQDLDEAKLDPELQPILAQYKAALAHTGWKVLASEHRVAHPALAYAGTLDLHIEDAKGHHAIVDVKSGGHSRTVGLQTMAYANAFNAMMGESRKLKRFCLYLKRDRFNLVPLQDDALDWATFVSCLNVLKWKEKHHGSARAAA